MITRDDLTIVNVEYERHPYTDNLVIKVIAKYKEIYQMHSITFLQNEIMIRQIEGCQDKVIEELVEMLNLTER